MLCYSQVRVIEETELETPFKRGSSLEVQGFPVKIKCHFNFGLRIHELSACELPSPSGTPNEVVRNRRKSLYMANNMAMF